MAIDDDLAAIAKLQLQHAAGLQFVIDVRSTGIQRLLDPRQRCLGQGVELGFFHHIPSANITIFADIMRTFATILALLLLVACGTKTSLTLPPKPASGSSSFDYICSPVLPMIAPDPKRRRLSTMNPFAYRNGILCAEGVPLPQIAAEHGTPCYVYSRAALLSRFEAFRQALAGRDALICYAVKANSNLAILNQFARAGAGFDIVSGGELARVIAAGGDPAKVVFSGVGKTR